MRRALSGSLQHLAPAALLRLVSATAPSGILELVTDAGTLRLDVDRGRIEQPSEEQLRRAGEILASDEGTFRFEPCSIEQIHGEGLTLSAYAEAAATSARIAGAVDDREIDMNQLVAGEILDLSRPAADAKIHVLPSAPPDNPLDDLLTDLEAEAPEELLFAQIGVVAHDPRLWHGAIDREWRRRGWQIRLFSALDEVDPTNLDVLVVHHQLATIRVGHEEDWLLLIRRAAKVDNRVPVVWIAPLGDPVWVHQLIDAGVSFLMPAPQGDAGETLHRFTDALTLVVDRQLVGDRRIGKPGLPQAVTELVDALLHDADSDQAIGSMLQLASGELNRGAVLLVEETSIRCRAGFGYPLDKDVMVLPRGVGLLERVIRSAEALVSIEPEAGGARHLAGVLGVATLPAATAVIPLGNGSSVAGLLVADREGDPLPDLRELVLLAGRLGGLAFGS